MLLRIGGRAVFPLYGIDGGVAARVIVYGFLKGASKCPQMLDGGTLGGAGVMELEDGWWKIAVEYPYSKTRQRDFFDQLQADFLARIHEIRGRAA